MNERPPAKRADDGRRRRRRRRRGGRGRGQTPQVRPGDERLQSGSAAAEASGPEVLDEFNLFCAYHMGVTGGNGYKFQSVAEVARRFGTTPAVIKERLADYALEVETLRSCGFEVEFYQLDIKVAPEGVSRRELARTMWEELVSLRGPAPGPKVVEDAPEAEDEAEAEAETDDIDEAEYAADADDAYDAEDAVDADEAIEAMASLAAAIE